MEEQASDPGPPPIGRAQQVGCIGCLSALVGMFGGGMIAVLIGKIVGSVRGCQPIEELPACNWESYAGIGMVVGVVLVPLVSIWKLKGRRS